MAKDRTRHARRRDQERAYVSLYGIAARVMAQELADFTDGTARALADFADAASSAVVDFAEMCGRLTDEQD